MVVDDDALVRSALRTLLDAASGIRFAGDASDGADLEAAVTKHQPDVVLIDLQMPRIDGATATSQLHRSRPEVPVIVLTNHIGDTHLLKALQAGAVGYLLKNSPPHEITAAVLAAANGEMVLSPIVTQHLVEAFVALEVQPHLSPSWADALTVRERDIAEAVSAGMSNQQIAEQLYMSLSTVKTNVSRILAKLGLDNRVQLALVVHGLLGRSRAPLTDGD